MKNSLQNFSNENYIHNKCLDAFLKIKNSGDQYDISSFQVNNEIYSICKANNEYTFVKRVNHSKFVLPINNINLERKSLDEIETILYESIKI